MSEESKLIFSIPMYIRNEKESLKAHAKNINKKVQMREDEWKRTQANMPSEKSVWCFKAMIPSIIGHGNTMKSLVG